MINFSLPANGASVSSSGDLNANYPASAVIDGNRRSPNYAASSGSGRAWHSLSTASVGSPVWLEIDLGTAREIKEIDVFFVPTSPTSGTSPTLSETSTNCSLDFKIQYWNGSAWVDISSVTANDKVWRQFTFSPLTTTKVRFLCTSGVSGYGYSIVTEVEVWGDPPVLNITTTTLPNATQGVAYSQSLAAVNGVGSLAWSQPGIVDGLPPGLTISSGGVISGTPTLAGTYTFTVQVADSASSIDTQSLTIVVDLPPPLPYGFEHAGTELFCEAALLTSTNGAAISSFTDQSLNARHLTAVSSQPTFQTAVVNGLPIIRWSGTNNPLAVTAPFTFRCGWVVAKFSGSSFSAYQGLLTDLTSQVILTSDTTGMNFFDAGYDYFEFRSNDRVYPDSAAPAPLGAFRLIFFKFWKNLSVSGIRLGQDRDFTARKFNGDIALVVLSSKDFCEKDIRARSAAIAAAYGLTLADVFPLQGQKSDKVVTSKRVLSDDQDEPIVRVKRGTRRAFDLTFATRTQDECITAENFWTSHYPSGPFIYRDYQVIPPVDTLVRLPVPSEFTRNGVESVNNFNFEFPVIETV